MKYLKYLLLNVFAFVFSYMNAQTESIINRNDSTLFCNKCDSLYNGMLANEEKHRVFSGPEIFPQFHGGVVKMLEFVVEHIKYPAECKEDSIQGRVIVRFIIDELGKVICPRIIKSLHPAADEEALRVVKIMPDWQPASNNGIPCKMDFILPVTFK
jgi:protein TonB